MSNEQICTMAAMAHPHEKKSEWRSYYQAQLTMPSLLDRAAKYHPDTEVVTQISGGRAHVISYKEHQKRSVLLGSALVKCGIKRGDVVATFMWNNSRHLQIYHAVPCIGCVLHTVNIRLHPEKLAFIIQHAEDEVIFVDESLLSLLRKVSKEALTRIKMLVICGKDEMPCSLSVEDKNDLSRSFPSIRRIVTYEELLSEGSPTFQWPSAALDEDMPMALCYTSGTTGMPKGVMYSHKSQYITILNNMAASQTGFCPHDTALPVVPMFHAMAWGDNSSNSTSNSDSGSGRNSGIAYAALASGCRLILTNEYMKPDDTAEMILKHGVTVVSGVPTIWQGIRRSLEQNPDKYSRWFWQNWGVEVVQTWGMTETNPLGTAARRIDGQKQLRHSSDLHLKTVGRPVCLALAATAENAAYAMTKYESAPKMFILTVARDCSSHHVTQHAQILNANDALGNEVRIVHPETKKSLPNDGKHVGELLVRGPVVISAYYKKIGTTPDKFVEGWLNTGDLASISHDGYVTIHDRSKDVIKSGGEWISSIDMANHLMKLNDNFKHVAVVGVFHPKWDERPIVVIELADKSRKAPTLKEIRKHCARVFAKFQLPDDVLVWNEIPVSGTGKIDKKVIRAKLKSMNYKLPQLRSLL
eukprot:jgi/Bigna1/87362/estExt_fgenesh1_pg.C_190162